MAWYLNHYRHDDCDTEWTDEWSCMCNDRCPVCRCEIEPYDSEDLSIIVEENPSGGWIVRVSSDEAEHDPDYSDTLVTTQKDAFAYAAAKDQERDEAKSVGGDERAQDRHGTPPTLREAGTNANFSNYALRLPASLKKAAEEAAAKDGATLNQFIVAAVAEKLGAYGAAEFFAARAVGADLAVFDEIMSRSGGVAPPEEDRL